MPYFRSRQYQTDTPGGLDLYAQKVSSEIAEAVDNSGAPAPAFGWVNAVVALSPVVPRAITMRALDLVSADGTKRRRVPVGEIANSSLWADPSLTVDLQDALGNTVTYSVVGRIGEKRRFPQTGAY